jgi:hypothetical protein
MTGKVEGVHVEVLVEQLVQECQLGAAAQGAMQEE